MFSVNLSNLTLQTHSRHSKNTQDESNLTVLHLLSFNIFPMALSLVLLNQCNIYSQYFMNMLISNVYMLKRLSSTSKAENQTVELASRDASQSCQKILKWLKFPENALLPILLYRSTEQNFLKTGITEQGIYKAGMFEFTCHLWNQRMHKSQH